jgi:hypothetical protein
MVSDSKEVEWWRVGAEYYTTVAKRDAYELGGHMMITPEYPLRPPVFKLFFVLRPPRTLMIPPSLKGLADHEVIPFFFFSYPSLPFISFISRMLSLIDMCGME